MRLDVVHTNADKLLAFRVDKPPNAVELFGVDVARCTFGVCRGSEQEQGENQCR